MSKHISYVHDQGWMDITVPPEMIEEFKTLVRRAASTWQDMSPEMRDFADRVLGVDKIMGQNMKEGHSSNVRSFEFHGVRLIEDLRLPPDTIVAVKAEHSSNVRNADWNGIAYTIIAVNELSSNPICNKDPETCGCSQHWQG